MPSARDRFSVGQPDALRSAFKVFLRVCTDNPMPEPQASVFVSVPRATEYSVISYSSYEGAKTWYALDGDFPQILMMYDIAALQYMYGANLDNGGDQNTLENPQYRHDLHDHLGWRWHRYLQLL